LKFRSSHKEQRAEGCEVIDLRPTHRVEDLSMAMSLDAIEGASPASVKTFLSRVDNMIGHVARSSGQS
jgi:hypothetical protein